MKLDQTISVTSTAPAAAKVGGVTYTLTATATSGLAVTFAIDATASSACSIAGSVVSFTGVGTCEINANQPGNANYDAAPRVTQNFNQHCAGTASGLGPIGDRERHHYRVLHRRWGHAQIWHRAVHSG